MMCACRFGQLRTERVEDSCDPALTGTTQHLSALIAVSATFMPTQVHKAEVCQSAWRNKTLGLLEVCTSYVLGATSVSFAAKLNEFVCTSLIEK